MLESLSWRHRTTWHWASVGEWLKYWADSEWGSGSDFIEIALSSFLAPRIERLAHVFLKSASWRWVTVPWQMQCLQDQEALIPQPRGALPKGCAAAAAATTIGCIAFLSPEGLFGWVAMVILILTLGPLLHGLCLLAEEMLYHSNTRWEKSCVCAFSFPGCLIQMKYFSQKTQLPREEAEARDMKLSQKCLLTADLTMVQVIQQVQRYDKFAKQISLRSDPQELQDTMFSWNWTMGNQFHS